MDTPGTDRSVAEARRRGSTAINWFCTIGFAVAAVFWLFRYFMKRQPDSH